MNIVTVKFHKIFISLVVFYCFEGTDKFEPLF
jgi:hypothetical protein